MFDFITYLAQSALCLVALYIIYKATMSHETLHRLNRVTLLAMVVLSAVLPMCRIKIVQEVETVLTPIVDDMSATAVAVDAAPETIDYRPIMEDALVVIFLLGAAFMVVRLAMSWLSVWRVVRSGESRNLTDGVTLSIVDKLSSPFSWFRHVVVSRADMGENRDLILEHELAHVRFGHSWDVLFVDLALIVWWFNPAMWLLRRELQSLHEY
ncbi:MAG: M56 family peptidase, partial [Alistipes sp.]|nr:M56 family peptidase [Alistipes sp.]